MIADGVTPRTTKFETDKEKLRQTIRAVLSKAKSFDEFSALLLREGVTVKESRGRYSSPHAGQDEAHHRPEAGTDFDKPAALALFAENDFVKISWHIFLKDFVSYAASFRES